MGPAATTGQPVVHLVGHATSRRTSSSSDGTAAAGREEVEQLVVALHGEQVEGAVAGRLLPITGHLRREHAQPGERAVLGDPDRAGGHAEGAAGLLGRETDGDAQDQQLTLVGRQPVEQAAHEDGVAVAHRLVLGPGPRSGSSGMLVGRDRGPHRRALGVGHLVRGDAEDERLERAPLVAIARQGRQHGETHLLRDVVRGVLAPGQPS